MYISHCEQGIVFVKFKVIKVLSLRYESFSDFRRVGSHYVTDSHVANIPLDLIRLFSKSARSSRKVAGFMT